MADLSLHPDSEHIPPTLDPHTQPDIEFQDPEVVYRNEQFVMTQMGVSFAMILGMTFGMAGLTIAFMSDQVKGLEAVGWGMAIFTFSSMIHLLVSRIWCGRTDSQAIARNGYLFVLSLLAASFYLYALFSDTVYVFTGFIAANLYFPLFGRFILSIEPPTPPLRQGGFNITPFSRVALSAIVLVGIIIGMGVGMSSSGSQSTGRGLFARKIVVRKIDHSRKSIHMIVFRFIKPYRILQALAAKERSGVRVEVLAKSGTFKNDPSSLDTLRAAGIPVRILPSDTPKWLRPYSIIDSRILLQGSKGWADTPIPFQKQLSVQSSMLLFERIRRMDYNFRVFWEHSRPLDLSPSRIGQPSVP